MSRIVIALLVVFIMIFLLVGDYDAAQLAEFSADAQAVKNVVAPASGFMVSVSDTWTSGGPYGGEFEILAISPSHQDVI